MGRHPVDLGIDDPDGEHLTLDDLADPGRLRALTDEILTCRPDTSFRGAQLTPLHWAIWAASSVILAPALIDGRILVADPEDIAVVVNDERELELFRVNPPECELRATPARIARALNECLDPVADAVSSSGGVGRRAVQNVVRDSIAATCDRLDRVRFGEVRHASADVTAAMSDGDHRLGRELAVRADVGPVVILRVPQTCCVLATAADEHSCPTCPRHGDDRTRSAQARTWLRSLDLAGFRHVAGRDRAQYPR